MVIPLDHLIENLTNKNEKLVIEEKRESLQILPHINSVV